MNEFRNYLLFLAKVEFDSRLKQKFDASDIVQQTLLDAHRRKDQFQGSTEAEKAAWLRQILSNNLIDTIRRYGSQKRNLNRERSLDSALEHSSRNLEQFWASDGERPVDKAIRQEQALLLADAFAQLPESQQEALVLQKRRGWSLSEIADHMGSTPPAVAGLLKRGLRRLREVLSAEEMRNRDDA